MRFPSAGPFDASLMVIGSFPSERDDPSQGPFSDFTSTFFSKALQRAGIQRTQCYMTYAFKETLGERGTMRQVARIGKDYDKTLHTRTLWGKPVSPLIAQEQETLLEEISRIKPKAILLVGDLALWLLTGKWGVKTWRGSYFEVEGIPTIPTLDPHSVLREYPLERDLVRDLVRVEGWANGRSLLPPNPRFIIRPDLHTTLVTLASLHSTLEETPTRLSVDIETRAGHIACIGLAWSRQDAICIPFMDVTHVDGYWGLEEETTIIEWLGKILTHPNAEVIGQNWLYDSQYIYRWWLFVPNLSRDTMIAHHSIFSNLRKGLDYLSATYCDHHIYWKDESKDWDPKIGEEQLWTYNAKDCVVTYEVDEKEQATIEALTPSWPKLPEIATFQQRLFPAVLAAMNRGIRADKKTRERMGTELFNEIFERQQFLEEVLGGPVNIKSPKQMCDLFYTILNQKPIFNRKTHSVTCDDNALFTLARREPLLRPITDKISELRSIGVFLSTFVNAPLDIDGRLRCSFNIAGTETYRFSSSKNAFGSGTNFQNIPKGGDDSGGLILPNIRKMFVPDSGYTMFDIDLDSADLRIVCWESDCSEMKAMLREGAKVYVEVAREYYRDPTIDKNHPKYGTFKSFCHGTHYLGTAAGLAKRLNLSEREVEKLQRWYFGKFPEIPLWHKEFANQVHTQRFVENVFGYRIYWHDRFQGTYLNELIAWLPQSTVACLINRGFVNIHEKLPEVQVLLQVHDSLPGQFPTHLADKLIPQIKQQTEIELPYRDPLTIPLGIKTSTNSWGEC